MIRIPEALTANMAAATLREWIETNGLGGYASSTILGMNTRRYHGLLVAAINPPVNRHVIVSKVEETIVIKGDKYCLSSNQYKGEVFPDGHKYLKEFRLTPFPKFIYQIGEYRVEKSVFMIHGKNATAVKYLILPDKGDVELYVRPMLAYRHFHQLQTGHQNMINDISISQHAVKITPNWSLPPLYMYHSADIFRDKGFWYNNFEYREEAYRGFQCHEDLFNPGYFIFTFYRPSRYDAWIVFSTEPFVGVNINSIEEQEIVRRSKLVKRMPADHSFLEPLVFAADSFIVQRDDKPNTSIIAGYHWFEDWSRDAMVALPGLTLATGRFQIAKEMLFAYSQKFNKGLLPNYFTDTNEPVYNTVDASLWFFYALYKYLLYTNDYKFAESLIPQLKSVIQAYMKGTLFDIHMNDRNLITFSETQLPLTWMDAIGSDSRSRQRKGMVVEVNALWYTALKVMSHILSKTDYLSDAAYYAHLADDIKTSFNAVFQNPVTGYLNDFVDEDYTETALRPNQILSIGLPFAVLEENYMEKVINVVRENLLTPFGLRTLSPDHPCFAPHYRGGEGPRNIAYHQGTTWTWLLGFYATCLVRVYRRTPQTVAQATSLFSAFHEHLRVGGIGTVSEIFDGAMPYYFRGCISQAWSVGEILRAYNEDILGDGSYQPLFNRLSILKNNREDQTSNAEDNKSSSI